MILNADVSIIKQVEIPEAVIKLRSDGIVYVYYKKDTVLDVELQLRMRKIYDELTNGKKQKFIFAADEGFVLSREARENAPRMQEESPILYYAMIANNLAYKIVANFYIRVLKPKGNYRVFNNLDGAVKWLNEQSNDMEDKSAS